MKILKIFLLATIVFSFSQCKEEEGNKTVYGKVAITYQITNAGVPVVLQEKISFDGLNEFKLEKFKFHLANLEAKNSSGAVSIQKVAIIDFEEPGLTSFEYSIPVGSYTHLNFGSGLDAAQNDSDPASFEMDHPLSAAQGMYWSWAMKYRFSIVEGRASETDTIGTPADIIMAYHPGANEFYNTYNQPISFNIVEGKTVEIIVNIELETIFNSGSAGNINIPTEYQTHTTPDDYPLADKFSTNFGEAITFRLK